MIQVHPNWHHDVQRHKTQSNKGYSQGSSEYEHGQHFGFFEDGISVEH